MITAQSLETFWVGRTAVVLSVVAVVVAALWAFGPSSPMLTALARYRARLRQDLCLIRSPLTGGHVLAGQGVTLLLALVLALFGRYFVASALASIAMCPGTLIARARVRWVERLEQQLEPWLTALANALRATPSLGDALASTASLLKDPIGGELELVIKENQMGCPLDRALAQATERIGSSTFKAAVTILKTARRTGGNLPETLAIAAGNLREMARLEGVVRAKTAEGKAQSLVISAIPLPLYFGIRVMSPDFFLPLETTVTGHFIFGIAAMLWLAAFILSRRILMVDI